MFSNTEMVKQWKEYPPGPEQLALVDMFEKGEIKDYDTSDTAQAKNPLFKDFSERVFLTHFRKTKARLGGFGNLYDYSFMKCNFMKKFDYFL